MTVCIVDAQGRVLFGQSAQSIRRQKSKLGTPQNRTVKSESVPLEPTRYTV